MSRISAEEQEKFVELTDPLIEWMNKNTNPHAVIIVEQDGARLYSGEIGYHTDKFIKD